MMDYLVALFLEFVAFSVAGWAFETVYCSIVERRFVNRGFLNGPYCPIYGAGAVAGIVLLGTIENNAVLALAGALVACALEYVTSYVMERLYHARWWDYSNHFLNLNGRICLLGATCFGLGSLVCVRLIHPLLVTAIGLLPQSGRYALAFACAASLLADLAITHMGLSGFRDKIDELCDILTERTQQAYATVVEGDNLVARGINRVQGSALGQAYSKAAERIHELAPGPVAVEDLAAAFARKLTSQELRVLKAFPHARPTKLRSQTLEWFRSIRERIRHQ